MKRIEQEQMFKKLALEYNNYYGEILRQESIELEESNNIIDSKNLDKNVLKYIKNKKSRMVMYIASLVAVFLGIFLINPFINRNPNIVATPYQGNSERGLYQDRNTGGSEELYQEFSGSPDCIMDQVPPIEADFYLPEGFLIIDQSNNDQGIIYNLEDNSGNSILLQINYDQANLFDEEKYEDLELIDIIGHDAYISLDNNMISFKKDDLYYNLSSENNLQNLILLAEHILR